MPYHAMSLTTVAMIALASPLSPPALHTNTETVTISEIAPRGPAGPHDEYIELRNTADAPVDIGGWRLYSCDSVASVTLVLLFPAATAMAPHGRPGQYLLLAGNDYQGRSDHPGPQTPDIWSDLDMSVSGGWMLADRHSRPVDGIGAGSADGCQDFPQVPRCEWTDDEAATRRAPAEAAVGAGYVCRPATPTNSTG